MAIFGRAALLLALCAAVAAIVFALGSRTPGRRRWQAAAERAVYAAFALVVTAALTMWSALLGDHFELRNVHDYSNEALPTRFKITGLWASQAGSLLLWTLVLTSFAALAVFVNRHKNRELMPIVVAVLMGLGVFFLGILSFISSPFETLADPSEPFGLNPLLQNPYMVIHPPLLYVGYVGLAVPFAFGIAALVTRRLDTAWIASIRRWTVVAWIFLAIGILLGSRWAYEELGWGGYWFWDPVENAAFMPWLVATAFLHSIMVQERRGMLKVWNVSLVTLAFSLSVFGTFLTRSGVVSSVHAFGESTLGIYLLGLIVVMLVGSISLIVSRLPFLKSEHQLESYLSRETVFLVNNLLLLGIAATTLLGTLYPIAYEAAQGSRITVGRGYYDALAVPLGALLLIFTGIGPLVPWRKATWAQLGQRLAVPVAIAVLVGVAMIPLGAWGSWKAGIIFVSAGFVVVCVASEFVRGARTRHRLGGVSWLGALTQLVARNRRRYGGYLVHVAIAVLFVGLAGSSAFSKEADLTLAPGERAEAIGFTFQNACGSRPAADPALDPCPRTRDANAMRVRVAIDVFRDGDRIATLRPGTNQYIVAAQRTSEVDIVTGFRGDLYAVFAEVDPVTRTFTVTVFHNPLVAWMWAAGVLMVLGTLVAVWPTRRSVAPAAVAAGETTGRAA